MRRDLRIVARQHSTAGERPDSGTSMPAHGQDEPPAREPPPGGRSSPRRWPSAVQAPSRARAGVHGSSGAPQRVVSGEHWRARSACSARRSDTGRPSLGTRARLPGAAGPAPPAGGSTGTSTALPDPFADSAIPTSRPAWSTTAPPDTGHERGVERIAAGTAGSRGPSGHGHRSGGADRDRHTYEPDSRCRPRGRWRAAAARRSGRWRARPGVRRNRGCSARYWITRCRRTGRGPRSDRAGPSAVVSWQRGGAPDVVGAGQHRPTVAVDDEPQAWRRLPAVRRPRRPRPGSRAPPRTASSPGPRGASRRRRTPTRTRPRRTAAVESLETNRSIEAILWRPSRGQQAPRHGGRPLCSTSSSRIRARSRRKDYHAVRHPTRLTARPLSAVSDPCAVCPRLPPKHPPSDPRPARRRRRDGCCSPR